MSPIEWNPRMSVGVAELDAEHQQMIQMINELGRAIDAGQGQEALAPIFAGLVAYTELHFQHEEELLATHAFPGIEEHRRQHAAFVKDVQKHKAAFDGHQRMDVGEIQKFLKKWVIEHIMGSDRKYSTHLNQAGLR